MREMIGQCESNIRELQQLQVSEGLHASSPRRQCVTTKMGLQLVTRACLVLQNEKCHLLIENETQKLKHLDEQHNQLMKDWRDQLKPRKKVRVSCHKGVYDPLFFIFYSAASADLK